MLISTHLGLDGGFLHTVYIVVPLVGAISLNISFVYTESFVLVYQFSTTLW